MIISTTKESGTFDEDMKVAFELFGPILYRFDIEEQISEPKEYTDNISITQSLDVTSHFESSAEDVCRVYSAMTGMELDLRIPEEVEN